jgi:cell division protein FtsB
MILSGIGPSATVTVLGWLNRILVGLIALALLGAIAVRYRPLLKQDANLRADIARQEAEVARLKAEVGRLDAEVRALRTDPRTVERRLREIGYARPDDVIVTFLPKRR